MLLDLFCGQGGAAMGYHRAGFDVVGVDVVPQPRYPFEFVQADALEVAAELAERFDVAAIHASAPCQLFSSTRAWLESMGKGRDHPDLIDPTRELLIEIGRPYVIENVEGAPLLDPVMICGTMFDPVMEVQRHRLFECNWQLLPPMWPCRHLLNAPRFPPDDGIRRRAGHLLRVVPVYGSTRRNSSKALWERAMGIDWMTVQGLTQAIPPAYTEFIGRQLAGVVAAVAA